MSTTHHTTGDTVVQIPERFLPLLRTTALMEVNGACGDIGHSLDERMSDDEIDRKLESLQRALAALDSVRTGGGEVSAAAFELLAHAASRDEHGRVEQWENGSLRDLAAAATLLADYDQWLAEQEAV